MKRNVWIFGLIMGAILAGNAVYMTTRIYHEPLSMKSNDLVGYAVLVVVLSLTFFGIRNYRNKELGGAISLGKAFKTGGMIALVGSTLYVGVWICYYYLFIPDFIDKYTLCVLNEATLSGASATELAAKKNEMQEFGEMYENPLFVILISYAEVLPIGLVVAFISSLILKRKPKPESLSAS